MRANAKDEDAVIDDVRRRLLAAGRIDEAAWARASAARRQTGERADRVLIKLGLAPEADVIRALADSLGLPAAEPDDYADAAGAVDLGPVRPEFLRANGLAPLREAGAAFRVATEDPFDAFAVTALEKALGRPVETLVGAPADIRTALDRLFGHEDAQGRRRRDAEAGTLGEEDVARLRDLASEAPVIRRVNDLIDAAVALDASDIHLEPEPAGLRVRLRVDGLLREHDLWPASEAQAVLSRVKIMARLDIAERRLPQDGRFRTTSRGRAIDLRVSTLPAIHGEAAVLRVLDHATRRATLEDLALPSSELATLRRLLRRPDGLILVTGPTGSGKTTTLYAGLAEVATPEVKVLTVEDPIEHRLERALQIQVKPDIGLGFPETLRAFLRHDPDVIMVGEIRDRETAEIAARAALTGHLVLSTLHTRTAAGAVERLRDMGVGRDVLSPAVSGLLAQRLMRRLCDHCAEPAPAPVSAILQEIEALGIDVRTARWRRAVGCSACGGAGYRGRRAILEVLPVTASIREMIHAGAPASAIEDQGRAEGARSLREMALRVVATGETSAEELARVLQET